jgi:predicted amidohydrolase
LWNYVISGRLICRSIVTWRRSAEYVYHFSLSNYLAHQHTGIVPGTLVESHRSASTDADKLLNVAYFISPTGAIVGKYIKKNLWGPERDHLTSSTHDPHEVFDTPIGKVGLLICWDLAFPEAFRELIANGAKIIIVPTFWTHRDCSEVGLGWNPGAEGVFLDSLVTARAFENTCGMNPNYSSLPWSFVWV